MNPVGIFVTTSLCLLTVFGSRRWAMVSIVWSTCYITQGQELDLGLHFTSIRLVLLVGLARVIVRGELKQISVNKIDRGLVIYALCLVVIPIIRTGSVAQFTYQIGFLYNIILAYFVCRALIKNEKEISETLSLLALSLIPFALLLILESRTGQNQFAIFEGVDQISMIRDGHVRTSAAFRSPITCGAFGATLAMLYISMLFGRTGHRRNAVIGLILSLIIVGCAHSSGPFLGLVFGLISLACWKVRNHTGAIRRGLVAMLVILHFFIMKAPVWYLIARVSDVVGGGGYHRSLLIDQFVNRFSSWWLLGTDNTSGWMPYDLEIGGADLTNIFVSDGVNGGLIGLIMSVVLLVRCFQGIGIGLIAKKASNLESQKMTWGIGSALVANVAILFSVTYFDQMHAIWCFLLACVAAVSYEKVVPKLNTGPIESGVNIQSR